MVLHRRDKLRGQLLVEGLEQRSVPTAGLGGNQFAVPPKIYPYVVASLAGPSAPVAEGGTLTYAVRITNATSTSPGYVIDLPTGYPIEPPAGWTDLFWTPFDFQYETQATGVKFLAQFREDSASSGGKLRVSATFSKGTVGIDTSSQFPSANVVDDIGTLAAYETVTGSISITPSEDGVMAASYFNGSTYATAYATVAQPEVVATALPVNGSAFSPLTGVSVATFTHGDGSESPDQFTTTINWGDGTVTSGSVIHSGNSYTVLGTHTYTEPGAYRLSVRLNDAGASQVLNTTANIGEELLPDGMRGTPDQRFVLEVYRDLLKRKVDPAGLSAWTGLLDAGVSRFAVVRAIEISPSNEYRMVEAETVYRQYLHRDPDPSGLQRSVQFLAAGGTVEQLAALLIGSQEYFQARVGSSNTGFLAALYQDALQRQVDPTGRAGALPALAAGLPRQQVAALIFAGSEYARLQAASFYRQFLDRNPDPIGLTRVAMNLQAGLADDLAIALLAASDEFFAKA